MGEERHGGRLIADHLADEGVDALFTLTGGHISPIYDGCRDRGIRVIDVRHEQAAAHAADAYGRLTFRPGVAAVTAGPGVTDAITGVTNAAYAHSPMVLLGGRNPLALEGMGGLQDAPQVELLRPVTKRADTVFETRRIREVLDGSFRAALAPRMGPTYVDLPMDVLMTPIDVDQLVPTGGQRATTASAPDPDAVTAVAGLLAAAERPVVLCGSGAYWARSSEALDALATSAQLPVFVNGMARGLLPSEHPHLLGLSRKHALRQADVVLALGIDFDFRVGFGRPPAYRDDVQVVHVDPQPDRIGHNRPVAHGIVSDVTSFLVALLRHDGDFGRRTPTPWLEELRGQEVERREAQASAAASDASPVHPLRFAREVARWVDPEAIVIGDGGDIVAHTAGQVRVEHPGHWMDPGPFGCLGSALRSPWRPGMCIRTGPYWSSTATVRSASTGWSSSPRSDRIFRSSGSSATTVPGGR